MRKIALIVLLLAGGCVAPSEEGVAYSGGGLGPQTDAARINDKDWLVSCYANLSACTWRANQVCPAGFSVTNTMSSQESSGHVNADGGGFSTDTKYTLAVTCKS